ncbi:hypothetical protein HYH03_006824 [Edaphochlamys debaryana]|uniref:Uncharacterized protein n=1 Tax=Edaphochlamys debaryana TaxID=47281 RepID=A0A835Y5R0_9CHLO|nr:hypothetical protein HYH03_006824 [Edaphochlamys debaryana]|eukprot:KAG2495218.1 hypothetical protein HYH03_006824 [Edaphochlamys debaryana]
MSALSSRVAGPKSCSSTSATLSTSSRSAPTLRAPAPQRPVCRPLLLAPGPRTPRRQRTRLVTTNFKPSDTHEEAPVVRPKPVRHPLTEDPFAGAAPSETATREVLLGEAPRASTAAREPEKASSFSQSVVRVALHMRDLMMRPRALLLSLARNSMSYGLPLLLAYFARQPLAAFWAFYCGALDSHPLITKVATGIVGTILGDYVAQRLSHNVEEQTARQGGKPAPAFQFDLLRTSRLCIYGAIVGTPVGHFWFQLLDTKVFPEAMTSPLAVLTKMSLDQLLMCPTATALFFTVMRIWEGHPNDALSYMRTKIAPTLRANYVLWPAAHIINFAFVPPAQRILYCNAVGVIWTVILSTILNSRPAPAPVPEAAGAAAAPVVGEGGLPPSDQQGSDFGQPNSVASRGRRSRTSPPQGPPPLVTPSFAASSGDFDATLRQRLASRHGGSAPAAGGVSYAASAAPDAPREE